jgi:RNA-splicing ligase RtcB
MGTANLKTNKPDISLVTPDKSWIDGLALQQLVKAAPLPGIERAAGFTDLHPGKGDPIGAVFVSREVFCPPVAGKLSAPDFCREGGGHFTEMQQVHEVRDAHNRWQQHQQQRRGDLVKIFTRQKFMERPTNV